MKLYKVRGDYRGGSVRDIASGLSSRTAADRVVAEAISQGWHNILVAAYEEEETGDTEKAVA